MGMRTNPDRILENIDRAREKEEAHLRESRDQPAAGRELDTAVPDDDATDPERTKRVFGLVERAYVKAARRDELGKLASRFRAVGDIPEHRARGDISVTIRYLDHDRPDDQGVAPFEVRPDEVAEAKKETNTSRPDVNAMKVLREKLRGGVIAAYRKVEPRVREAIRERADLGHVEATVTVDVRPF